MEDENRNLNACAEAIVARLMFGKSYAKSRLGQQDYYDTLSDHFKQDCRDFVDEIKSARRDKETPKTQNKTE